MAYCHSTLLASPTASALDLGPTLPMTKPPPPARLRPCSDYHGHLSGVYSIALHPELDLLMTGGRDSVVRVWDMRSKVQAMVLSGHEQTVCSLLTDAADPQVRVLWCLLWVLMVVCAVVLRICWYSGILMCCGTCSAAVDHGYVLDMLDGLVCVL